MKIVLAAVLAAMALTGCAAHGGPGAADDTLLQCRALADEAHKARYTPAWEATVQDCLEARAAGQGG
ncbi:hypothetical protein [Desulfocurvus vexinensis]|uniref:hypothetical protein n=1 Tax=Desulfocurvus vexinensis TaxID=399548 RepID=UPI000490050D|nr:hypothetical protein [Desulfocurvus vexinensis]